MSSVARLLFCDEHAERNTTMTNRNRVIGNGYVTKIGGLKEANDEYHH
jgi:hypothetical protein